jgi:response regulator of citrate/malate metabolism
MRQGAMSDWTLEPICCSSLQEARTVLLEVVPSLIFCDAQLPDGVYQELLLTLGKMAKARFVMLTSAQRRNIRRGNAVGGIRRNR